MCNVHGRGCGQQCNWLCISVMCSASRYVAWATPCCTTPTDCCDPCFVLVPTTYTPTPRSVGLCGDVSGARRHPLLPLHRLPSHALARAGAGGAGAPTCVKLVWQLVWNALQLYCSSQKQQPNHCAATARTVHHSLPNLPTHPPLCLDRGARGMAPSVAWASCRTCAWRCSGAGTTPCPTPAASRWVLAGPRLESVLLSCTSGPSCLDGH